MITDQQVEEYMRGKLAEAQSLRPDGYASVGIEMYGFSTATTATRFHVNAGASSNLFEGKNLTHAIDKLRELKPNVEAARFREDAARLLAKAESIEAESATL